VKHAPGSALATVLALLVAAGCGDDESGAASRGERSGGAVDGKARAGRLGARPASGRTGREAAGVRKLSLAGGAEGLLRVPAAYSPARPPALVVMLHGAGSGARGGMAPLRELADEAGLMLLAPKSRGQTWDVIGAGFGADVASIDALLEHVFARFAVDPSRIALGGFSDGASYALSLGPPNGDLFTHLIAFSPGFMVPAPRRGRPPIYVSHGVEDRVLPIESCSRQIVPSLRRRGYEVRYTEFAGGHTVPRPVARAAVTWLGR
jgi:phospholipase/carboxylesterase